MCSWLNPNPGQALPLTLLKWGARGAGGRQASLLPCLVCACLLGWGGVYDVGMLPCYHGVMSQSPVTPPENVEGNGDTEPICSRFLVDEPR